METFDIYISYSPEDYDRVRRIVDELEWVGLRVWFRNQPETSQESLQILRQRINRNTCHVVVWSHNSAASGRIQAEARSSSATGRLIATRLDPVIPPKDTKAEVYADLTNWTGGQDHQGMKKLLHAIHRLIGKGVEPDVQESPEATSSYASDNSMLTDAEKDEKAWKTCLAFNNKTYYNYYLEHFPHGKYVQEARERIAKKQRTANIILACAIIYIVVQVIVSLAINLSRI